MYSWLSKIISEIYIFNFGVSIIQIHYIYMSKDVRICGYFSKPKPVHKQTSLGNIGLRHKGLQVSPKPHFKDVGKKSAKQL